jgi:serine/threonine-protein kinase RsbW
MTPAPWSGERSNDPVAHGEEASVASPALPFPEPALEDPAVAESPLPPEGEHSAGATLLLPHATTSVGAARAQVQRDLVQKGVPDDLVDNTVLVVSEIVSNALKHARPLRDGKVRVSWSTAPDAVALEVTDGGGATRPRLTSAPVTAGAGRGLTVVGRLSREWGVREASAETTVWAVVDLDERSAARHVVDLRTSDDMAR